MKVHKGDTPVINLSVIFAAIALLFAPHVTIIGIIAAMILGYRFSFSQMDADFAADNLKTTVKNAADNVKATVNSAVKTIKETVAQETAKAEAKKGTKEAAQPVIKVETKAETKPEEKAEIELETMAERIVNVPTIQVPVQTETKDGNVTLEDDTDGYSSVTIG